MTIIMSEFEAEMCIVFEEGIVTKDGACWAGFLTEPWNGDDPLWTHRIPVTMWEGGRVVQDHGTLDNLLAAVDAIAPLDQWVPIC
jgi:hypothetical protein